MFDFLKKQGGSKVDLLINQYIKIKEFYVKNPISAERKKELSELIEKFGYLPYSQAKALEELTEEEVIFCLEKKLEINGLFQDGNLKIKENEISAVKRAGYKNSSWISSTI